MNKIYKLLIVLTFLGLFFLGKYTWATIPKYEWQERMVVHEREFSFKDWCWDGENCYCQKVEIKDCKCIYDSKKYIDKNCWEHSDYDYKSGKTLWGREVCTAPITKTICYIKEKVKIN